METFNKGITVTGIHLLDCNCFKTGNEWKKTVELEKRKTAINCDTHFVLRYDINSLCISIYRYID